MPLSPKSVPPTRVITCPETIFPAASYMETGPAGTRDRIGDYRIIRYIAKGGMGAVYEGLHEQLGLPVALKMINAGEGATEVDIQRFLVEARAVASLHSHPNIVKIHDIGQDNGQTYLVMQLINGGSLRDSLSEFSANPRLAVELMIKVADAIGHAHRMGVLHRDLKPDNVLMDEAGTPYVTDFGLAKRVDPAEVAEMTVGPAVARKPSSRPSKERAGPVGFESSETQGGTILGTPSFMPPEQALGQVKDISTLSDVYGLGATLFSLLCKQGPFVGSSVRDILEQVVNSPAPDPRVLNPKVDADLAAVCRKALEKVPTDRYESALAFGRDLRRWLDGKSVRARPLSVCQKIGRWLRHEPLQVAATLLCLVLLTFAVGLDVVRNRELLSEKKQLQEHLVAEKAKKAEGQAMAGSAATLLEAREAIRGLVEAFEASLGSNRVQDELRKTLLKHAQAYFKSIVDRESKYSNNDVDHLLELARAHRHLAEFANKIDNKDRQGVDGHYATFFEILRPITVLSARIQSAGGHHDYGMLLSERGETAKAMGYFEQGRIGWENLCDFCSTHRGKACGCGGTIEVRTGLGRSHGYIGDYYRNAGEADKAQKAYARSHEIRRKLYLDHDKEYEGPNLAIQLGRSHGNLSWIARNKGDLDGAIREQEEGLRLIQNLPARGNPSDRWYRNALEDQANGLTQLAEFHIENHAADKAIEALNRNLEPFNNLAGLPSGSARMSVFRAAAEMAHARALYSMNKQDEAQSACELAEQSLLNARDVNDWVVYRRTDGRVHALAGRIALGRGQPKAAAEAFRAALASFDLLLKDDDKNLDYRSDNAEILADLARTEPSDKAKETLRRAANEQGEIVRSAGGNRLFRERMATINEQLEKTGTTF